MHGAKTLTIGDWRPQLVPAVEIGKICSKTLAEHSASQPRPVKDPAAALSHDQDPELPSLIPVHCDAANQCGAG